jgi:hypothetical protein
MNYKIRITEDNQDIVERIADENGMNPSNFKFHLTESFFIIKENKFYVGNVGYNESIFLDYPEITTDQFIELFDKKETEWQPKRGDRVLVWDDEESKARERIFLVELKGAEFPIVTVTIDTIDKFKNGHPFNITSYQHMKPLPIEQPKETDFKSKVIELIENEIKNAKEKEDRNSQKKEYYFAELYKNEINTSKFLLEKIKQL